MNADAGPPFGTPDTPSSPSRDPPRPTENELFVVPEGDLVGLIAFDEANAYAAIFSPVSANGELCSWKSRWVRVSKGGGQPSELGDAATCSFFLGASAAVLGSDLYWLAHERVSGGLDSAAVLMTMPTTGGAARRVNRYDRDYVGLVTDGTSLFVADEGAFGASYEDGAVVRIGRDGVATTLASDQPHARLVGVVGDSVVWVAEDGCFAGQCKSTSFKSVPVNGGPVHVIATRPPLPGFPMTVDDAAIYYFDNGKEIRRLSIDGGDAPFMTLPWDVGSPVSTPVSLVRLRVHGDEVLASDADSVDPVLLAMPRRYDPAIVDSAVFEVDGDYAYAQRKGAFTQLGIP